MGNGTTDERRDCSDHDLLVRIDERVEELRGQFRRHTAHHWAFYGILLSSVGGAIAYVVFGA